MSDQTQLSNITVKNAREAQIQFGQRSYRSVPLRARVAPSCGCCFPYFVIPEGFYATVTSFGEILRHTDGQGNKSPVWPAGCYWKRNLCCSGIRELVTKQTIVLDTPLSSNLYTRDNIPVKVDVCLQLRIMADATMGEDPENLLHFVNKTDPASLQSLLKDAQEETLRSMVRRMTRDTIYGLRAMREDGSYAPIRLDQLNNDEYGPEAAMASSPPAVDMERHGEMKTQQVMPTTAVEPDQVGVELPPRMSENGEVLLADPEAAVSGNSPSAPLFAPEGSSEAHVRITERMLERLNKQFNKYGVEICDLQIQDVRLPQNIQSAIETKTTLDTSTRTEEMKQRQRMQAIEHKNEYELKYQEYGNDGEQIVEAGKKLVATVNNQLDREKAETEKTLRNVREESKSTILQIKAEAQKQVAALKANTEKILALPMYVPTAETAQLMGDPAFEGKEMVVENVSQLVTDYARGKVQKMRAEANLEVAEIRAITEHKVAELDAQATQALSLPKVKLDAAVASMCGKPEWEGREMLASTIAQLVSFILCVLPSTAEVRRTLTRTFLSSADLVHRMPIKIVEYANSESDALVAEAKLTISQAEANSSKQQFLAEAKANAALQDRRDFSIQQKRVEVYRKLANNDSLFMSAADPDSMLPNMVSVTADGANNPWKPLMQLAESVAKRVGGEAATSRLMSGDNASDTL